MSEIEAHGLTAEVPRGCDGRIFRRSARRPMATGAASASASGIGDGTVNPVVHLANFALPEPRGDYGSGAVERMGPGDVLVCVLEFDREASGTPLFARKGVPELTASDFSPSTMQRTIAGMCGAQAFFRERGRAFCAYVVLGSYARRGALVPIANQLLAGVSVRS